MKIGETLNFLLTKHGLNITELSKRTGIGQPVIYRIVSGETSDPKISTLRTIAHYFCISVDQLIGIAPLDEAKTTDNISLPLISWNDVANLLSLPDSFWQNASRINTDIPSKRGMFAVYLLDHSMEPVFSRNTLLIIDQHKKAKHGSYVIAKLRGYPKAIFRQLLIDSNTKYLKPLNSDFNEFRIKLFTEKDQILGTLLQAKRDFL